MHNFTYGFLFANMLKIKKKRPLWDVFYLQIQKIKDK